MDEELYYIFLNIRQVIYKMLCWGSAYLSHLHLWDNFLFNRIKYAAKYICVNNSHVLAM